MKRHIMFLMLSDVKADRDNPTRVSITEYQQGIGKCAVTNESAVRYFLLQEEAGKRLQLDKLFLFATNKVKEPIAIANCPDFSAGCTHLDFFRKRLKDVLPGIEKEDFIETVPFDEKEAIANTIDTILNMAGRIMKYAKEKHPNDEVVLHADLTGGPRHVVMLMLAVMRLLQYNGIAIGKTLYSNFQNKIVEEANDIYRLFDLIAGADEFAQFGSVSAILRYFGYKREDGKLAGGTSGSPSLDALLRAMDGFAEEIKICHYGAFRHAIEELAQAWHAFRTAREEGLHGVDAHMMAQLRFRIEAEYDTILSETLDDLRLMEWCVRHNYPQQALTLFTERVPIFLQESGILHLDPAFKEKVAQEKGKDDKRRTIFYLFADYRDEAAETIMSKLDSRLAKAQSAYLKNIRCIMGEALDGKQVEDFDLLQALGFDQELIQILQEADVLENHRKMCAWGKNPEALAAEINLDPFGRMLADKFRLYKRTQRLKAHPENEAKFDANWEDFFNHKMKPAQKCKELSKFIKDAMNPEDATALFSRLERKPGAEKILSLRHWLDKGDLSCKIPREQLEQILSLYQTIKTERNLSNHAREDSEPGKAREVIAYIEEGIRLLKDGQKQLQRA